MGSRLWRDKAYKNILDDLFDVAALEQSDHNHVQLSDGGTPSTTHSSSYKWYNSDVLANVLVGPDLKYNLISITQLTRNLHFALLSKIFSGVLCISGPVVIWEGQGEW